MHRLKQQKSCPQKTQQSCKTLALLNENLLPEHCRVSPRCKSWTGRSSTSLVVDLSFGFRSSSGPRPGLANLRSSWIFAPPPPPFGTAWTRQGLVLETAPGHSSMFQRAPPSRAHDHYPFSIDRLHGGIWLQRSVPDACECQDLGTIFLK